MEILYQQQVKKLRSLQNEKSQKTRMINKLTKNYLVNKVAFLFSGLLVTNIINLLGFFIIAKLFSVTTLGEYYMFIATASILNVFLTLGYLHSIPILKDDELKDMYLSITLLSILVLILVSPLIYYFFDFALLLLVFSLAQVFTSLSQQVFIKDQLIKKLNITNIGTSISNMCFTIGSFYLFGDNLFYLILMTTLSSTLVNLTVYLIYLKSYNLFYLRSLEINILKKYIKFVKYIGPGMAFHTIAYQIPILIAGNFFSPAVAAYYNMAFKLVYLPATLISASVSQVFVGKLSINNRNGENIFQSFNDLAKYMAIVAILFIISTITILPYFIEIFFGEKWIGSIEISFALLPLVFSLIAISPLTNVFQFTNNQEKVFILHFFSFLISLISFAIGVFLRDFVIGVYIFTISMLIRYVIIMLALNKLKKEYET
jgi:O-antigen/teichoic acid export membrane protein